MRFPNRKLFNTVAGLFTLLWFCLAAHSAMAAPDGLQVLTSKHNFKDLEKRVAAAIKANGMLRVFKASASAAAKGRGVSIPGDSVYGVYRNDFAVRMINANPLAGTEAPILIHVMEQPDGTAQIAYKTPSSVFSPYTDGHDDLAVLAKELDKVFAAIAEQAVAQ